jgi:predicted DCC family thiol-disulfide oxidoreductase YuxK
MAKTKVYYNSACPVCDAGIKQQQGRLEGCDADVEWIDVHADNRAAAQIGAELEFVRERLHVVDESGIVRVGSDAFSALWSLTPGQGWLARLSGLPILRTCLRCAYNGFAAVLYRWNRWNGRW